MTVHWNCPATGQRGELYFPEEQDARDFSTLFHPGVDVILEHH